MNQNKKRDEVLQYVFNNKLLKDALKSIIPPNHYNDFHSHFIFIICNYDEKKLIGLYNRHELDWFCLRIITNQWKSKTSDYFKMYKNNGFSGNLIDTNEKGDEIYNLDEIEDDEYIDSDKAYPEDIKKEMIELLEHQYEDLLINQYHKTLFNMYFIRDMTLKAIEAETEINFNAVSRSIRKTKEYLRERLKNKLK